MFYRGILLLSLGGLSGCSGSEKPLSATEESKRESVILGSHFDSRQCGDLQGQVRWDGEKPRLEPVDFTRLLPGKGVFSKRFDNPHTPKIDEQNRIGEAMLFLREVNPQRSKPTPLSTVKVVFSDFEIHVANSPSQRFGFHQEGTELEMESLDKTFRGLRARGASFFTLMFPPESKRIQRKLSESGMIEFSSASGEYWTRAWVMVLAHPYGTLSDASGKFDLKEIPEGEYELICWMPNWNLERVELDVETGIRTRQFYKPAVEKVQKIQVRKGEISEATFQFSWKDFSDLKSHP